MEQALTLARPLGNAAALAPAVSTFVVALGALVLRLLVFLLIERAHIARLRLAWRVRALRTLRYAARRIWPSTRRSLGDHLLRCFRVDTAHDKLLIS
jgi:hypothetical protein